MTASKISPEAKNLLTWIGAALIEIQMTEKIIKLVLDFMFPKTELTPELVLEMFDSKDKKQRNKTLGFILTELHKRVDLHDRFDETLGLFLEMRNTVVHNLEEIPGWSLDTEKGMAVARTFLSKLLHVTDIVSSVFLGLIRSWAEENEMDINWSDLPFFARIDEIYKPLVTSIFFAKE